MTKDQPRKGRRSPEVVTADFLRRGTSVRISEVHRDFRFLKSDETSANLAVIFALYLRQYPEIRIFYNNDPVDPGAVEAHAEIKMLPNIIDAVGKSYPCELEIVEWKVRTARRLYFCNLHGFPLDDVAPGIQAPGFEFTAYLKSDYFAELVVENALDLAGWTPQWKWRSAPQGLRYVIISASGLRSNRGDLWKNGKKRISIHTRTSRLTRYSARSGRSLISRR